MIKNELIELLKDLGGDDDVDDILRHNKSLSELFDKNLTLNDVKNFINSNDEGKQYIQSYGDRRVTEGIEKFKKGAMQTIINDEVLKATGKKKTPEQIQIEELQKKFEAQEKENTRLKNESTVKSMLSEAGFDPSKALEFFNIDDMENMETRIGNFKALIDEKTQAGIKDAIASGSYTPPGENGSGELSVDDLAKMMM